MTDDEFIALNHGRNNPDTHVLVYSDVYEAFRIEAACSYRELGNGRGNWRVVTSGTANEMDKEKLRYERELMTAK